MPSVCFKSADVCKRRGKCIYYYIIIIILAVILYSALSDYYYIIIILTVILISTAPSIIIRTVILYSALSACLFRSLCVYAPIYECMESLHVCLCVFAIVIERTNSEDYVCIMYMYLYTMYIHFALW